MPSKKRKRKKPSHVLPGQAAFFFHDEPHAKKRGARPKAKRAVTGTVHGLAGTKPRRKTRAKINGALGEYLKAKGMYDAETGADPEWRVRAARAIIRVAKEKETFTTDDVWLTGLDKPREPRALGPEMASAQVAGIIEATNVFKLTAQASRHRAPVRFWKSLIYKR